MANGKIKNGELHIGAKFALWILGIAFTAGICYAGIKTNCDAITDNKQGLKDHDSRLRQVEDAVIEFRVASEDIKLIKDHLLKKK